MRLDRGDALCCTDMIGELTNLHSTRSGKGLKHHSRSRTQLGLGAPIGYVSTFDAPMGAVR